MFTIKVKNVVNRYIVNDYKIFIMTASYYISTYLLFSFFHLETNNSIYISTIKMLTALTLLFTLFYQFFSMVLEKEPHPLFKLIRIPYEILMEPKELVKTISLLAAIIISLTCYTNIKTLIGYTFPFNFDLMFYQIDKFIHFGHSPWQLTHYIFSSAYATSVINIIYNLWFFIVWFTLIYFVFYVHEKRYQYVFGFIACWIILGSICAILFASSGPVFIGKIESSTFYYSELFNILQSQNVTLESHGWPSLWALSTQDMLWNAHSSSTMAVGGGISAMPSMHLSMATYMALNMGQLNKKIGTLYWLFTIAILIGSVHLGWHYAIDGYVSIILTVILWKLTNFMLRPSQTHLLKT